jgi:hypothetical protein
MAQKKSRQTFEKLKREQAVRERRLRKQERKAAARLAKVEGYEAPAEADGVDSGESTVERGDLG